MNQPEYILADSEKISQPWDHSKVTFQILLDLEVDLVVLHRELSRLADMCTRITGSIHEFRVSELEQE